MINLTPEQLDTLSTLVQDELETHAETVDEQALAESADAPASADVAYLLDLEELLEALAKA